MATENELIEIPSEKALDVFTREGGIEPYIQIVRDAVADFVPSVATDEDRALVRSTAFKVVKSRTYLEGVGKRVADEQKTIPKKIDEARRRARTELETIEEQIRGPLTKWEADEKARKEKHLAAIRSLEAIGETAGLGDTVKSLRSQLEGVQAMDISEAACEEFHGEYVHTWNRTQDALTRAIIAREKHDAEQAELAQLRAEKEQRDKAERERIAAQQVKEQQEAAERAQEERVRLAEARAAEQARAEERAEAQRQQEARDRADRERERIQREEAAARQKEADEQAARERNTRHKGQINRAAAEALTNQTGISTAAAQKIVELIVRGKVPGVSIRY